MPAKQIIYVINPNSLSKVTDAINTAIAPLRFSGGPQINCVTLIEGPRGIQSQRDVERVVAPLCKVIETYSEQCKEQGVHAVSFVIACFSDPGLYCARECTDKPVLGIAESGMLMAMTMGHKIGVISILKRSIARHLRYFAAMGITDRLCGDIAVELDVVELADAEQTFARLYEVGCELRDNYGADVLVFGCAGMAAYRKRLEQAMGIPVVEPCQAAVTLAMGQMVCRT